MQNSLIVYGIEDVFKQKEVIENLANESILIYYASEIFLDFGFASFLDFQEALQKTFTILNTARIPINNHIRIIFRGQNQQIFQDWRLSSLACHLIKINGALDNQNVVNYQIEMHSLFQY